MIAAGLEEHGATNFILPVPPFSRKLSRAGAREQRGTCKEALGLNPARPGWFMILRPDPLPAEERIWLFAGQTPESRVQGVMNPDILQDV